MSRSQIVSCSAGITPGLYASSYFQDNNLKKNSVKSYVACGALAVKLARLRVLLAKQDEPKSFFLGKDLHFFSVVY